MIDAASVHPPKGIRSVNHLVSFKKTYHNWIDDKKTLTRYRYCHVNYFCFDHYRVSLDFRSFSEVDAGPTRRG